MDELHTENSDIPSNSIRDVLIINEDLKRVWLATADGAALYNNGQWQIFEWPSLASNNVLSLGIDTHGNVWVGLDDAGLSAFNGTTWTDYYT